jgi:hypothetical protein
LGIFATEGGQFIGGHGMSEENKLKTAAGLLGQPMANSLHKPSKVGSGQVSIGSSGGAGAGQSVSSAVFVPARSALLLSASPRTLSQIALVRPKGRGTHRQSIDGAPPGKITFKAP